MGIKKTTEGIGCAQYSGADAVVTLSTAPASGIALPGSASPGVTCPSYAVIIIEGGTGRWMCDPLRLAPTSSLGMPLSGELDLDGPLAQFRIFLPSGTTMNVAYFV